MHGEERRTGHDWRGEECGGESREGKRGEERRRREKMRGGDKRIGAEVERRGGCKCNLFTIVKT